MTTLNFSKLVWTENQDLYNKIIQQPFNQELSQGILATDKFSYYIEQDSLYLKDFAKALAGIACKLSPPDEISQFIDFAKGAIVAEQEVVHEYFRKELKQQTINKVSLACIGYTSYLLRCVSSEAVEVAMAAVTPCFWVYNEVGKHIKQHSVANNPYQNWVDAYAGEEFSTGVNKMLALVDKYYKNANSETQQLMLQAFKNSMIWEYRFWEDSYNFNYFAE